MAFRKKEVHAVPQKGDNYYYIFACMMNHKYIIKEGLYLGGMTDAFRLSKGNLYMDEKEAKEVCKLLNERLDEVKTDLGIPVEKESDAA